MRDRVTWFAQKEQRPAKLHGTDWHFLNELKRELKA
jgi:hypothetical protein